MALVTMSKALRKWYPAIYEKIGSELRLAGHNYVEGGWPDNIWCRDYLAVETAWGREAFRYSRIIEPSENITLDGGNVVQNSKLVLMTEMVRRYNPHPDIDQRLERIFGKQLVLLPVEPEDELGHADGIVAFCGDNKVLVNDYSVMQDKAWDDYQKELHKRLEAVGLKPVLFPFAYHKCPQLTDAQFRHSYPHGDANAPCCGYYINFLALSNLVLLPVFGFNEDQLAIKAAQKHFPDCAVVPIHCFELGMLGGLLHCVTHETAT